MDWPDPKAFAERLVAIINNANAPTRAKVAKLEIDNAVLRGAIAELRAELSAVRDTLSATTRPRSVA